MRDPVPGHWRRAIVSVALTMLLGAVLFLLAANYHRDSGAYNSDNLLCTDFCDDVLCGRSLSGWHLPGAPYLFPDMLLLLPIHALAPDLFVEFAAYAIVFHLLLAATVAFVAIGLGLGRWEAILSGVGGVLFMATAHLGPAYAYRGLLLVYPGSHCSAVLVGLFLLGLTLASLRRGLGLGTGALFVLVGSLGTLSDRLLIVQFLAPLGLALFFARHWPPTRSAAVPASCLCTGSRRLAGRGVPSGPGAGWACASSPGREPGPTPPCRLACLCQPTP